MDHPILRHELTRRGCRLAYTNGALRRWEVRFKDSVLIHAQSRSDVVFACQRFIASGKLDLKLKELQQHETETGSRVAADATGDKKRPAVAAAGR